MFFPNYILSHNLVLDFKTLPMKLILPSKLKVLFSLVFIVSKFYSQEWTYMGGTSLTAQFSVYGTQGVAAASNQPGARNSSAFWTDNNGDFWFLGGSGYTAAGGSLVGSSDLWKYNKSTNLWTWVKGPTTGDQQGIYGTPGTPAVGNTPGGREYSATWTDNAGNLWLYGGYGADAVSGGILNDLWKFDISTSQWTWIHGSSTANAAAVYGTQGTAAAANTPGARFNSMSWKDANGDLWLFGGGSLMTSYNDLWKYTISSNQWTWVSGSNSTNQAGVYGTQGTAAATNVPGARQAGMTWVDNSGNFWLYGGSGNASSGAGYLNDLWKYNPLAAQWTWMKGSNVINSPGTYGSIGIAAAGNAPSSRWQANSFKDNAGNLFLYAGEGNSSTSTAGRLNDVWKYKIATNEWMWIKGSNTVNQPGIYGTVGVMAPANTPAAKWGIASWMDNTGALWTFGGNLNANGHMNDLWKFIPCTVLPPNPLNTTSLANQNICAGNTTTLSATSNTHLVNWYSTATSTSVLSTGVNFTTTILPVGTYTFYTDGEGCQNSTGRTAIGFTVNALPVISVNSGSICAGKTFTLIPAGASTYTYSSGSSLVSPLNTTTYSITGKNAMGCLSSNAAIATVTVNALPQITVNSGTICSGQIFTIVPSGALTYSYSSTFATVAPTITTSYSVTGTDVNGCKSGAAAISVVNVNANPVISASSSASVICSGENALLLAIGADTYSWSTGATGNSTVVHPTATVIYTVTGTNTNGCFATLTLMQQVNACTGIKNTDLKEIKLYPNPNAGEFYIESVQSVTIEITNISGQLVYTGSLEPGKNKIDLTSCEKGIYFTKLRLADEIKIIKLIRE